MYLFKSYLYSFVSSIFFNGLIDDILGFPMIICVIAVFSLFMSEEDSFVLIKEVNIFESSYFNLLLK